MSIVRREAGKGHYYLIDGKKADGVTTLIGDGLPKPALTYWAAKSVAEYVADHRDHVTDCFDWMDRDQLVALLKGVPWSQRDKAAVKGTTVHRLAERLSRGEEIEVPEELAGYVNGCVAFFDEWRIEPILSETVVASRRWNYCGTFDLIGKLPDGRVVIADYKTSASGIFPEAALQLAAYANAEVYLDADGKEQSMAALGVSGGLGIWLRDGAYSVVELDISEPVFKAFCHIAYVARTAKGAMKTWRSDAETPTWDQAEAAAS